MTLGTRSRFLFVATRPPLRKSDSVSQRNPFCCLATRRAKASDCRCTKGHASADSNFQGCLERVALGLNQSPNLTAQRGNVTENQHNARVEENRERGQIAQRLRCKAAALV